MRWKECKIEKRGPENLWHVVDGKGRTIVVPVFPTREGDTDFSRLTLAFKKWYVAYEYLARRQKEESLDAVRGSLHGIDEEILMQNRVDEFLSWLAWYRSESPDPRVHAALGTVITRAKKMQSGAVEGPRNLEFFDFPEPSSEE